MPAVSVIVLTYNSEKYIKRCLHSLERQTMADFEAIVVDAGSTDGTEAIVRSFDARFRWCVLAGSDMGTARNHGMKQSRGRYITFLDSDDFYLRAKLAAQAAELDRQGDVDVTFCEAWHYRTDRPERVGVKKGKNEPWGLRHFFSGHNRNLNTMCLRRRVWESGFCFGEGDRGKYGEEWRLQLAMAVAGIRMDFRSEPLVVVELRPDSHTSWSRQWIMKSQAMAELERVAAQLTPEQRGQIDGEAIIDSMRAKLVMALLLDGRRAQAREAIKTIQGRARARRALLIWRAMGLVPSRWSGALLRRLWLAAQNRSFDWQAMAPALRAEFAELQGGGHELR
jgi:hypothetical protein